MKQVNEFRNEFLQFLIMAKKHTYASQENNVFNQPALTGTRQLEYQDHAFLYRDIYVGMAYFAGQEIVYYLKKPVWSMCYAGRVLPSVAEEKTSVVYRFLRKALRKVALEYPYRGPSQYSENEFVYKNTVDGNIDRFHGMETILFEGIEIYSLDYSGGFLL